MDEEGAVCDSCGTRIGPLGCCSTIAHLTRRLRESWKQHAQAVTANLAMHAKELATLHAQLAAVRDAARTVTIKRTGDSEFLCNAGDFDPLSHGELYSVLYAVVRAIHGEPPTRDVEV